MDDETKTFIIFVLAVVAVMLSLIGAVAHHNIQPEVLCQSMCGFEKVQRLADGRCECK